MTEAPADADNKKNSQFRRKRRRLLDWLFFYIIGNYSVMFQ